MCVQILIDILLQSPRVDLDGGVLGARLPLKLLQMRFLYYNIAWGSLIYIQYCKKNHLILNISYEIYGIWNICTMIDSNINLISTSPRTWGVRPLLLYWMVVLCPLPRANSSNFSWHRCNLGASTGQEHPGLWCSGHLWLALLESSFPRCN